MEDSPVAVRLKSLIEALNLSDSQFADRCSISRPTLSLFLSGKNKKISDIMLSQIHQAFPQVSIIWLLFGEGNKFETEKNKIEESLFPDENQIFPDNTPRKEEELNLINVIQLENIVKDVVNKAFEHSFNTLDDIIKKNNAPLNLRKVRSITVYYDDSTFETFSPEK